MAECLVRDLDIIEATFAHRNQSYGKWCAISDKYKNRNKVKLTSKYDMG